MSKEEARDENAVGAQLAAMKLTNEHEKALSAGTTYYHLFRLDLQKVVP